MILLDTNLPIYALPTSESGTRHRSWAGAVIAEGVSSTGVGVNAVSLAEICVGAEDPEFVVTEIRAWGIEILDIPSAASLLCARAYQTNRQRRRRQSSLSAPATPLPDFFIGAHAEVMGASLATADASRFRTCFPKVPLITP